MNNSKKNIRPAVTFSRWPPENTYIMYQAGSLCSKHIFFDYIIFQLLSSEHKENIIKQSEYL